ncbi:MAG: hypothetical protein K6C14_08055, partial [Eubacterium sp.]|nr:hypothetical protein [Eubacterium sp.]
ETTYAQSLPSENAEEEIVYYDDDNMPVWDWKRLGDYTYYLEDGKIITDGFYYIDGDKYYLNEYGERLSGWFKHGSDRYYFLDDGGAVKGWFDITDSDNKKRTFYFDSDCVLVTGKRKINGSYYFFSKGSDGKQRGEMYKSEWREYTASGNTYKQYYNKNGVMLKGLKTIGEKTYYFNSDGVLQTKALVTVKKKTYFVNRNGVVQKNKFVYCDGCRYYVNKYGYVKKKGFFNVNGKRYYADKYGVLEKGWAKIGGKYYYFSKTDTKKRPKNSMITGKLKLNGKTYKFKKNGVCKNAE